MGDGVAAAGIADGLDAGDEVAHFAGREFLAGLAHDLEDAYFLDLVGGLVGHELDRVAGLDAPLEHPEMHDGAPEGIVVGVEDQGFQRGLGIARGGLQAGDDGLQDRLDADAFLGGNQKGGFRVQAEILLDLILDAVDLRRGQVDFVDDRDDVQVVLHGQIEVGQGLGFDPLAGVHEQQGPFAGGQGAGDLVGKIHVARGVDQIQVVAPAILGLVGQADCLALDGDAPFALDIHGVQDLILEIPGRHDVRGLDQAIREGRFPVIDMGDDAEVANKVHL